jgi:putative membrane protein
MLSKVIFPFLKGAAMGAANVIPGVSGGTIALITGIFARLIDAIKAFDATALKLLLKGRFKEFAGHTDFFFVVYLFAGIFAAIISLARLLEYLFLNHPVYVWSFFFGLVMASVWFVARTVKKWHIAAITFFLVGAGIAIAISVLTPAGEDRSFFYLFLCGVVAICSMILPGLSGSFVLVLMGNYQLVMIDAVNNFDLSILLPVGIGAVAGLIIFSRFLSWLLNRFPDSTIALLSGFILGSLGLLWPWKTEITQVFGDKVKVIAYEWHLPEVNSEFALALVFIILGILSIAVTEIWADKTQKEGADRS